MELTVLTEGTPESSRSYFVGESSNYLDSATFIKEVFEKYGLESKYLIPDTSIVQQNYAKKVTYEGFEDSYCFCEPQEDNAFKVYVIEEEDLTDRA